MRVDFQNLFPPETSLQFFGDDFGFDRLSVQKVLSPSEMSEHTHLDRHKVTPLHSEPFSKRPKKDFGL